MNEDMCDVMSGWGWWDYAVEIENEIIYVFIGGVSSVCCLYYDYEGLWWQYLIFKKHAVYVI